MNMNLAASSGPERVLTEYVKKSYTNNVGEQHKLFFFGAVLLELLTQLTIELLLLVAFTFLDI